MKQHVVKHMKNPLKYKRKHNIVEKHGEQVAVIYGE